MDTFLARGRVHSCKTVSDTDAGLRESVCAEISLQNRLTHILTHNRLSRSGFSITKWYSTAPKSENRQKPDNLFSMQKSLPAGIPPTGRDFIYYFILLAAIWRQCILPLGGNNRFSMEILMICCGWGDFAPSGGLSLWQETKTGGFCHGS